MEEFDEGTLEGALSCNECHALGEVLPPIRVGGGPDLAGYATTEWLRGIILNPNDDRFYGSRNDRMPAFKSQLGDKEISLLVRWMQGDWPRAQTNDGPSE